MIPAALVLIQADPILQKLLVSWPSLAHHPGPRRTHQGGKPRLEIVIERVRPKFHQWQEVSGVDVTVIESRAPILFGNGICYEDGSTDSNALSFIASMMLQSVNAPKSRRPAKK